MNGLRGRQILIREDAKTLWDNLFLFSSRKEMQVEEIRWKKMKCAMEKITMLHYDQVRYFERNHVEDNNQQVVSLYSEMWHELKIIISMDFSEYEQELLPVFHQWYPFYQKEKTS